MVLPFVVFLPYHFWIKGPGDRLLLTPEITDPEHRSFHLANFFFMSIGAFAVVCFLIGGTLVLVGTKRLTKDAVLPLSVFGALLIMLLLKLIFK